MSKKFPEALHTQELLYQALETELGAIRIYSAALPCAMNEDLHEEWETCLAHTRLHRDVLLDAFRRLGLDPETQTMGRQIAAFQGKSLVRAIELTYLAGDPVAAQITAAECVVLAGTKAQLNWELIGLVAQASKGELAHVLRAAHEQVQQEESRRLYCTKGWTRELWIESLGLPAVLPPDQETSEVEMALDATRLEQQRERVAWVH
ncbi:hypothetical protein [Tahibacter harae]|uniref:DUF892 family protein n=1 Tax=Tahibacter harae TaxID=2963937 RepID=A0ABT1QS04_9GAMM|nr:hypothetical protein [Tahibacter harae]MCQ4165073.1 hypothetical protein [Tahibacter harae]